uniref:Uncharacterized protein n=1 Tax=Ditylenchus dipsaci TaxID=166011 RepID=A0A915CSE9_9BILA
MPGLLHCDYLELNDYSMTDRMPMDDVIKYLYYQSDLSSLRRRTLYVGIAQLGGMSFSQVFNVLAQKMSTDTQPHPFLFGICGDRGQPQQRASNENTLELLMMMKGGRGMEFLRAQRGNYVR